jgi:hypothetical protein
MHTFRAGDFKDLTVEQAMLRDAPRLYGLMKWAHEQSISGLKNAVQDFDILRRKLRQAPVTAHCAQSGCQGTPCSMTFPVDKEGWCRVTPYYWCEKHEPWQRSGISQKYSIHFDAMRLMKTKFEKETIFRKLKIVFGIAPGTRITKEFARNFFAKFE